MNTMLKARGRKCARTYGAFFVSGIQHCVMLIFDLLTSVLFRHQLLVTRDAFPSILGLLHETVRF